MKKKNQQSPPNKPQPTISGETTSPSDQEQKSLVLQLFDAVREGRDYLEIMGASVNPVGTIKISPDMVREFKKNEESAERNKQIKSDREAAVAKEVTDVGDEVLPVDQEVTVHGGLTGKVVKVTKGYLDRPYYRVFLQDAEGQYGDPDEESNYGFFYARQFRNYGRGI